jgi:hypothetical protein
MSEILNYLSLLSASGCANILSIIPFAKNAMLPSITPLDPHVNMYQMGRRNDLSPIDVAKIRRYYNCDNMNWG